MEAVNLATWLNYEERFQNWILNVCF